MTALTVPFSDVPLDPSHIVTLRYVDPDARVTEQPKSLCDMSIRYLTIDEACNTAHLRCSRSRLYRLLDDFNDRVLPRVKQRRNRMIPHAELHHFMATDYIDLPCRQAQCAQHGPQGMLPFDPMPPRKPRPKR